MRVSVWVVSAIAVGYLTTLFTVATYADRRARLGRSLAANPYVYALSLGVYCTAWTFYGSVGLAASDGASFLPVYLGPTLVAGLWWFVYRKIIRVSSQQRITSIADFISARYGKSRLLGVMAAVLAVVGVVPYIALQLDAVATSFRVLTGTDSEAGTALVVALAMAGFAILFGTRHLDITEHHEGLVFAIAVESVVKLTAFLAAGVFVAFVLFDGPGDLFGRVAADPGLAHDLFRLGGDGSTVAYWDWAVTIGLSALAVMLLPRQWQMAVVENQDERHLDTAIWIFPLYLLIINVFVLPIAAAGRLTLPGTDADVYVLALPLEHGRPLLALVVFVGGLSAATSMVIVATVALSTMVSNDLIVPALLGDEMRDPRDQLDFSQLVLNIRRLSIVAITLAGFGYVRLTEGRLPLVSIGLISFAAIAQFAPAVIGGLYWKGGNRAGAVAGLLGGAATWAYSLALPTLVEGGLFGPGFIDEGPFGIGFLRPHALAGVDTMAPIASTTFWSLLINVGLYVGVSLSTSQVEIEARQATAFVDAFRSTDHPAPWESSASIGDLRRQLRRFLGPVRGDEALAAVVGAGAGDEDRADPAVLVHAERSLAGALGTVSARVVMASLVREATLTPDQVISMIDETSRVLAHSRRLEEQRRALEEAGWELRLANERLRDLDRMKNEFISTVTHELRTPLTSIRAFTEILTDNPDLDPGERARFLSIIQHESERLTRHINQVLDIAKFESGTMEWEMEDVDVADVVASAVRSLEPLYARSEVALVVDLPPVPVVVHGDEDRLTQVTLNLLSNAVKFTEPGRGRVEVGLDRSPERVTVRVTDNGIGVPAGEAEQIFERFHQVADHGTGAKPQGTGLGLAISREIVDHLGGTIWVEDGPEGGARFCFALPVVPPAPAEVGSGSIDERSDDVTGRASDRAIDEAAAGTIDGEEETIR
jgi:Na+/proline symporter/nitrogen-specific signal transduction histidine kinase